MAVIPTNIEFSRNIAIIVPVNIDITIIQTITHHHVITKNAAIIETIAINIPIAAVVDPCLPILPLLFNIDCIKYPPVAASAREMFSTIGRS